MTPSPCPRYQRSSKRSARGFTLLEVLVAFALLAVALTLLLGTLSGAARQVGEADLRSRAVLHAQSLLAATGVQAPLQEGQREGEWEDGRYHWSLQVQPYVEPRATDVTLAPVDAIGVPRLLELRLQVRWSQQRGGQLDWRTLRLVPPPVEATP